MPVLFHIAPRAGGTYGLIDQLHLPGLERCLRLFPELAFIGHSQPFWAEISGDVTEETRGGYPTGPVVGDGVVPRLLREYPNLFADISAGRQPSEQQLFSKRLLQRLLNQTGHGSRPHIGVVSLLGEPFPDFLVNAEPDMLLRKLLFELK